MTAEYESLYCRLHEWITNELEGKSSTEDRREIAKLLERSKLARQILVAYSQELASLRWSFAVHPEKLFSVLENQCHVEHSGRISSDSTSKTLGALHQFRILSKAWRLGGLAIAAGLFLALSWIVLQRQQQTNSAAGTAGPIGQVVHLANVQWSKSSNEFKEWSHLANGDTVRLDTGLIDLMLANGAEIELKGPAEFQLHSLNKASLRSGKLVARCGPDAVGFSVQTPHASIVDLGTAFGVSVVEGVRTDVAVYDGAVTVSAVEGTVSQPRHLTAGEALHVTNSGEFGRITVVSDDQLLIPRSLAHQGEGHSHLIGSVRDELQTSETVKYYRIIGQGFYEDCMAFVDRDHQWNGLDASGVPPFLVGGDYVLPFNNDKIYRMEVEVELTEPATLYVLLDNRISTPAWVLEEFIDTGWDVGLDESYEDREKVKSGVGAGVSVDHAFSVWRKDYPEPTIAKLGYLHPQDLVGDPRDIQICMYGIVVTDLVDDQEPALH